MFIGKKRLLLAITFSTLVACSSLTGGLLDAVTGGSDGIEATAQVGESNNKGVLAVQAGTSTEVGGVNGSSKIVTNSSMGMASMALIGMIPFVLLAFYLLPAPKWIQRRYNERNEKS